MSTMPDRGPVTTELVRMLTDLTNKPFGDGEAPCGPDTTPSMPYGFVEELEGGDGPSAGVGAPEATYGWAWQMTVVGSSRRSARMLADATSTAIIERRPRGYVNEIEGQGWRVNYRRLTTDTGTKPEGALWVARLRFNLGVRLVPVEA